MCTSWWGYMRSFINGFLKGPPCMFVVHRCVISPIKVMKFWYIYVLLGHSLWYLLIGEKRSYGLPTTMSVELAVSQCPLWLHTILVFDFYKLRESYYQMVFSCILKKELWLSCLYKGKSFLFLVHHPLMLKITSKGSTSKPRKFN